MSTYNDCSLCFKSKECGYEGKATECDKTLACCAKLGNQHNWRGFSITVQSPLARDSHLLNSAEQVKSKRVFCKLCSCEGVDGTVLCDDHLQGFKYAVAIVANTRPAVTAKHLMQAIMQQRDDVKATAAEVDRSQLPRLTVPEVQALRAEVEALQNAKQADIKHCPGCADVGTVPVLGTQQRVPCPVCKKGNDNGKSK